MIQDTSFIVDILGDEGDALAKLELIERENRPEKLSAITSLELHEGIRSSEKPENETEAVRSVLDSKHVIAADHAIMKAAGDLSGELIEEGQRIDREDCIIAATARSENEPVLTRNASNFQRIPDLEVETY
jgi:predicted nucleic acid-binding protein